MQCTDIPAKFPDSSQEPTLQAGLSKDRSLRSDTLIPVQWVEGKRFGGWMAQGDERNWSIKNEDHSLKKDDKASTKGDGLKKLYH